MSVTPAEMKTASATQRSHKGPSKMLCQYINATTTGATRRHKRFRRYRFSLAAEAITSPLKLRKKVEAKLYSPTTDELAMQPLIEKYLFESVYKNGNITDVVQIVH